ncbi:hypothetical protein PHLCEN_2v6592 [Hermanssonia centrifuga]|uniref:Uncharacterized protein n=1 Tax=Hermanssonia centrifuga TaxID=98765 RepID=A0A2R6NZ20_9APHY|nr:hypothetical protein PHLCEN_2v6592 [Hermanssonia centrifuga]
MPNTSDINAATTPLANPPQPVQAAPPLPTTPNLMVASPAMIAQARASAAGNGAAKTVVLPPILPGFLATSFREFSPLQNKHVRHAFSAIDALGNRPPR